MQHARGSGAAVLLVALAVSANALTRAYTVEPRTQLWSGWTGWQEPNNYVSQIITCNFDGPVYCELFVGQGSDAEYKVEMLTMPDGYTVADGDTVDNGSHKWVRFYFKSIEAESIIKGRKYEFRFTRAGSDSINFFLLRLLQPLRLRPDDSWRVRHRA